MSKLTTILAAANPPYEMTGNIAILPVGDRKVRFLIERLSDGSLGSLTHVASGYAVVHALKRFGISYLVQHGTWRRAPSARQLAEAAIADLIHTYGADEVLARFDSVPVLNT